MSQCKFRFNTALTPKGWENNILVVVDGGGMIESVNSGGKEGELISGIAIPAMPNVHSHAHQRLMAGLAETAGAEADSFWTWREAMYGFALKLEPDDLEAVAAQLYVEMLQAGFSCVGEFQYLHHQPDGSRYDEPAEMSLRCLSAADEAGIAITLLPTLYNFSGFGGKPANEGQRRFINSADKFLDIHQTLQDVCAVNPLRRLGIAPHSLRAVTVELLDEVMNAVDDATRMHIHVAEQAKEVEDCLAWSGQRPVDYLLDSFDVSPNWCAIHATHMTDAETARLAKSGAVAGLCPTTEANLGDGIFPASLFMKHKGAIAIGSDSHIMVSSAEELRQLEYSQRLRDRARNVLAKGKNASTGRTLFDAAAQGGAQCLDQPAGEIAVGKRCDIAVLDDRHPSLMGRNGDQILDSWIFSAGNAAVKDMIVGGRHIVKDRQHINGPLIKNRFEQTVRRLT